MIECPNGCERNKSAPYIIVVNHKTWWTGDKEGYAKSKIQDTTETKEYLCNKCMCLLKKKEKRIP